jgi:hypothetical protein
MPTNPRPSYAACFIQLCVYCWPGLLSSHWWQQWSVTSPRVVFLCCHSLRDLSIKCAPSSNIAEGDLISFTCLHWVVVVLHLVVLPTSPILLSSCPYHHGLSKHCCLSTNRCLCLPFATYLPGLVVVLPLVMLLPLDMPMPLVCPGCLLP